MRDPYADQYGRTPPLVPAECVWCGTDTHAAPEHVRDAACGACARRRHGVRMLSSTERARLAPPVSDRSTRGEGSTASSSLPPALSPKSTQRFEVLIGAQAADDGQVPPAARRFAELAAAHGWHVELVYALARDRRGEGTREVASLSVRCSRERGSPRRLIAMWINGSHVSLAGLSMARLRAELVKG